MTTVTKRRDEVCRAFQYDRCHRGDMNCPFVHKRMCPVFRDTGSCDRCPCDLGVHMKGFHFSSRGPGRRRPPPPRNPPSYHRHHGGRYGYGRPGPYSSRYHNRQPSPQQSPYPSSRRDPVFEQKQTPGGLDPHFGAGAYDPAESTIEYNRKLVERPSLAPVNPFETIVPSRLGRADLPHATSGGSSPPYVPSSPTYSEEELNDTDNNNNNNSTPNNVTSALSADPDQVEMLKALLQQNE